MTREELTIAWMRNLLRISLRVHHECGKQMDGSEWQPDVPDGFWLEMEAAAKGCAPPQAFVLAELEKA